MTCTLRRSSMSSHSRVGESYNISPHAASVFQSVCLGPESNTFRFIRGSRSTPYYGGTQLVVRGDRGHKVRYEESFRWKFKQSVEKHRDCLGLWERVANDDIAGNSSTDV